MVGITLRDITRRFGSTVAVDRATLDIARGELFFLLGPSGCGKTTLMRIIAGLLEPSAGRVLFDDRDVTDLPTAKRNTALVFQSYALWPHMTVAQNIAFGLDVRGIAASAKAQRVLEAMRRVHIDALAERRPGQLSGGQQQRVALARALVVNPDVLLLDEPLSNLDAKLRLEMRGEIRRICKETGVTTVYVTHDQDEALSIADRIALMRDGRVAQIGSPQEIYGRPNSRFVADFLGKTNFVPATVAGRENGHVVLESSAGVLKSASFPDDVPAGGHVTCSIRPESLRLLRHDEVPAANANVLSVRHVQTMYMGHLAQHVLEADADLRLAVEELKPAPRDWNDPRGLRVAFSPADLVILVD